MNLCKYSYNSTVPVTTDYLIIWKGTMTSWIFLTEETMIQNKFCEHYFTRRFSEQFRKANFFVTCTDRNNVPVAQKSNTRLQGSYLYSWACNYIAALLKDRFSSEVLFTWTCGSIARDGPIGCEAQALLQVLQVDRPNEASLQRLTYYRPHVSTAVRSITRFILTNLPAIKREKYLHMNNQSDGKWPYDCITW